VSEVNSHVVAEAADRLESAERTRRPVPPVRDLLGSTDVGLAYAVQQELVDRRLARGAVVVGRKIGLTAPVVQRQLGVDQPDFGVLFADMDVSGAAEVPSGQLFQPRVEAEIAFVLAEDLDGDLTDQRIRSSVGHACAALEIVDSRIAAWDITITDTVADNGSSGRFVLSDRVLRLDEFVPRDVAMRLYRDGELVSEGTGAACLGDPLAALGWLARTAQEFGNPLRAGQIVLSGALGPMVDAVAGARFHAEIGPLGPVTATFSGEETA
jgi:2-keto-4-pentenoate hydratase